MVAAASSRRRYQTYRGADVEEDFPAGALIRTTPSLHAVVSTSSSSSSLFFLDLRDADSELRGDIRGSTSMYLSPSLITCDRG